MLVSTVGTWLQMTAMSLLVYRLTGRATDLGITVALQFLPMLVLGAWAGAVADRHDRRTMVDRPHRRRSPSRRWCSALLDLAGLVNVPVVWALTLVLGVLNAFENPARRGLVTELVAPPDITNATSLNTAVMTGARIFGPALAAVMVETVGTAWCFLLNGVSVWRRAAVAAGHPTRRAVRPATGVRDGRPVREALAFIRGRRQLLVTFVVMAIVSTFAFNYGVSLPTLADEKWGGESNFGLVLSVTSIGSLTGALLTARLRLVSMRWYLGQHGAARRGRPGPGVGAEPGRRAALGDPGRARRCGVHQRGQRHRPAVQPARHARPPDGADRGGVPRIDADRRADHRLIGDRVGPEWALAYGSVATLVDRGGRGRRLGPGRSPPAAAPSIEPSSAASTR